MTPSTPPPPAETELSSAMGGGADIDSAPPGQPAAVPPAVFEERPEVQEAMADDTVALGLGVAGPDGSPAQPDHDSPDPDTPVFVEPGQPLPSS